MPKKYFFISDLHIGGDAGLDKCEFEQELILFLKKISTEKSAELIINGDMFGMWELTTTTTDKKIQKIIANHKKLFKTLQEAGQKIKITLLPGNHDYELAYYKPFIAELKKYNINLEQKEFITRKIGNKKIYIEHGHQQDSYNAISDFGNPNITPPGYYITRTAVSGTSHIARRGKSPWLNDLESVQPNEYVADWIFSNYFYREMGHIMRWITFPFLLLFGVSMIVLLLDILGTFGIKHLDNVSETIFNYMGIIGKSLDVIIGINILIFFFMLPIFVAIFFIIHDVKKILKRYGISMNKELESQKDENYIKHVQKIFRQDKDTAIYIFGHTHNPFIKQIGQKVIINTGSWLKRLTRISRRFIYLPPIYYPTFHLDYFEIYTQDKHIHIKHGEMPKTFKPDITFAQRIVLLGKSKKTNRNIPPEIIL